MRLLLGLAVLLTLASPAAGAWLQAGGNASHTGVADGPGPDWADVAFTVRVGGNPWAHPLIIGPYAYVLASPTDYEANGGLRAFGTPGIDRVDLDAGTVTRLVDLPGAPRAIASDGTGLLMTGNGGATLYDLNGTERWSWNAPAVTPVGGTADCGTGTWDGSWLVACTERTGPEGALLRTTAFAAAIASDGTQRWVRAMPSSDPPADPLTLPDQPTPAVIAATGGRVSAYGPTALFGYTEQMTAPSPESDLPGAGPLPRPHAQRVVFSALDKETGAPLWTRATEYSDRNHPADSSQPRLPPPAVSHPTGDANVVYIKLDASVYAINTRTGETLWTVPARQADTIEDYGGTAPALFENHLFIEAANSATMFNALTQEIEWRYGLPPSSGLVWDFDGTFLAESQLILGTSTDPAGPPYEQVIVSLDAATGAPRWLATLDTGAEFTGQMAVDGSHLVVNHPSSGNVTVLGPSSRSLAAEARTSALPPQPGETFHVDLSATRAGSEGPATEFRVLWGDGLDSGWQASPLFEHTYTQAGPQTARFLVRNPAGQSDSETLRLDVGAPRLNALQQAFSPENQNLTFFLIGLAFTAFFGLLGFLRIRRRLGFLQRELHAINEAYDRTRTRVVECEKALHERKAHVAGLLEDGRVDEAKFTVLERRIEELLRTVRTGVLDARFDYLPRGLARRLEGLLADGQVSPWEQEAFEVLLREDKLLTSKQKEQVRAMVARWAASDAT